MQLLPCLLLLSTTLALPSLHAAIVISDSSMTHALWTSSKVSDRSSPSTAASGTYTASASGRTDVRQISHTFGIAEPTRSDVVSSHLFEGSSYSPFSSGTIESLDFTLDLINTFGGTSGGVAAGVAVRQAGQLYLSTSSSVVFTGSGWQSLAFNDLDALDFRATDLSNPDFSTSGAPLHFGFFLSNGSSLNVSTGTTSFADNFEVAITSIPEPSHIALFLGTFVLVGAVWRRTK